MNAPLQASTLVGLTRENSVLDPLAVLNLDNRLYILGHTWLALADISSFGIPAPPSQADEWILQTLIHVDTRQSGIGQGVPVVALALEGPVHVNAPAIRTHPCL